MASARDLEVRPGAFCEVIDYPPGATFGPRTLRDFELVWLLHGSAEWICGERRETVDPGKLLLCRPGTTDEFRWDRRFPTRHAYVHFDLVRPPDHDRWPALRRLSPGDPLTALLDYLTWLGTSSPGRVADVLALLLATFVSGPLPSSSDDPTPIDAVVDFLGRRWADGITHAVTVGELADAATLSPSHLSRLFRARFGLGPAAAVELLRLARAEDLLRRSNLTVGAIATRCGFADGFHFSKRFRAVYGLPPRDFRAGREPVARPAAQAELRALGRWGATAWSAAEIAVTAEPDGGRTQKRV